ncbi:MAG: BamA/TamA family outer membrane protein [Prolixibacteraceae bacterium]|nr:BamA/TamA family outer membrane protein [Prolixibacteraceae bacterium]
MKKLVLFFVASLIILSLNAQDEVQKQGWKLSGVLPTVTFDSDLGFQYGALIDISNYGDGKRFPLADHHLYFEVSRFTKGSGINRFYYDSDKLFKGMLFFVDLSYLTDQAYDFYGFNGYDASYNDDWTDDTKPDNVYQSRMFYKYDRKMFRLKTDLQGKISGEHLRWSTGLSLLNFKIGSVNVDKLNKGKDDEDKLPEIDGLYDKYVDWGIISAEEADGGFVPTIKAGLVYDTRDFKSSPMKGIWTEVVLEGAPEFLGVESSFLKLSITHRQYFTVVAKKLSLAYRLNYQTTVAGHTPFYYQTQVLTSELRSASSEGLGGASTLRGILRNRVVGDGYFLGNVEARWKFAQFNIGNNNFYTGLVGFTDFGRVTNKIDVIVPANQVNYFDAGAEKLHLSYGAGLRIAMNETFILRVDYGLANDSRDGNSGMYIGLNYLF